MMKIKLGFSPCPNDTFIFDALVNKKIGTRGLEFETAIADVQQLNEWAIEGKLDVSKISTGVLPQISKQYVLLESGGALGKGVGPLLITKKEHIGRSPDQKDSTVALPGINTTAHFLFNRAYPRCTNKKFMLFSSIEDAVLQGECDFGVIIHENRFTYADKGLHLVKDLGHYWEESTGLPIPLGAIAARRTLPPETLRQIDRLIKESVNHAVLHQRDHLSDFVKRHAQEMSESVMRQHIDLYVNEYSVGIGEKGKQAIRWLYHEGIGEGTPKSTSIPDLHLFRD